MCYMYPIVFREVKYLLKLNVVILKKIVYLENML